MPISRYTYRQEITDQLLAKFTVFLEVLAERMRQDEQWGGPQHDDEHSTAQWVSYISKQLGYFSVDGGARERLVKVAALAFAALESMDREKLQTQGHSLERKPPLAKYIDFGKGHVVDQLTEFCVVCGHPREMFSINPDFPCVNRRIP